MTINVAMPPILYTSHTGQRYAVSGCHWVEVPADTTRDDLPRYMTWKASPLPESKPSKTWSVEGSKGNIYTVTDSGGQLSCTCPGYGWRRKCRHIENTKNNTTQ